MKTYYFILVLLCIAFVSCQNDDFTPYGLFQKKIIVSSVLDSRSTIQFAKVQRTYLPDDASKGAFDKTNIPNLKLYFTYNNRDYLLKDTLIAGLENYKVFSIKDFSPLRGGTYTVRAESDEFPTAISTIKIPNIQYIDIFFEIENINLLYGAQGTKGYLFGLYYDYTVTKGSQVTKFTTQIPFRAYPDPNNPDIKVLEFPELTKLRGAVYPISSLIYSLVSIAPIDTTSKVRIQKAYAVVYSFDENLYNYILSVSGFNDPYSVRLDQPFFSNIKEGFGLFGAIVSDTQKFVIPNDYLRAFNYFDEQQ